LGKKKWPLRIRFLNWPSLPDFQNANDKWDYGHFDACYPDCERFLALLEKSNWDRELIRKLIEAGWQYHQIHRTCMRWNQFRGVTHEIAQWVLDTLPGVYQKACGQFQEAIQLVSTADWVLYRKKADFEAELLP
jgi:hypothetical protein